MAFSLIPQIQSFEQLQRQLNTLIAQLQAAAPASGSSLPAATGEEGRLFTVTGTNKLYQLQSGAWVALT